MDFQVALAVDIDDGQERQELTRLLENSKQTMRKERKHYKWRSSVVVLDKIRKLGEFIEFYPITNQEKMSYLTVLV
jgi:adenylate cyclase class IV